jgi:hypothetical protein
MSNKRITKTFLKRLGGLILIIAAICLILGYCIAPSRPYLFVHLPTGGFIGQYASMAECRAARRSFAAGRGLSAATMNADLVIKATPNG